MLNLSQAAEIAGVSRSALLKAIQRGRLSAVRDNVLGQWQVDVAELSRVYALKSAPGSADETPMESAESSAVLAERVRALERVVDVLEGERDDLRRRLDMEAEERRRLTHLLTYQPDKSADIPKDRPRRAWWPFLAVLLVVVALVAAYVAFLPRHTEKPAPKASTPPQDQRVPWTPDDTGG